MNPIKFISVFLVRILPTKMRVDHTLKFDPLTFSEFAKNNKKTLSELVGFHTLAINDMKFINPESTKIFMG